ncbi:MAG: hypothetical protein ABFD84_11050 [Candidatus Polarisedimenticolia bacterium]|nr:hypothetical protein [bacterium]
MLRFLVGLAVIGGVVAAVSFVYSLASGEKPGEAAATGAANGAGCAIGLGQMIFGLLLVLFLAGLVMRIGGCVLRHL